MRVLLVTSRFPEAHGRGDQSRSFSFVRYLSRRHTVGVVSSAQASTPMAHAKLAAACQVHVIRPSLLERTTSAALAALRGEPAQVGWMMPDRVWLEVRTSARNFDVVLVNTVRSVRGPLGRPLVIDYVDALSWNMRTRARGPEGAFVRLFARFEAWRMGKWERRVGSWATGAIATSREVAASMPPNPPAAIIPIPWEGVAVDTPTADSRDIDVIFTGDMKYPPNREGAWLLARDIAPRVRAKRPDTTVWVVGRFAGGLRLPKVTIASDVPDISEYLRRAKVAVAPVRGKGSPYKVLEAAANGAAVVSYPWAVECYDLDAETAEDPLSFAAAIIRLLENESHRQKRARQGIAAAQAHTLEELGPRLERVLSEAARRT